MTFRGGQIETARGKSTQLCQSQNIHPPVLHHLASTDGETKQFTSLKLRFYVFWIVFWNSLDKKRLSKI